jgi:hypothetical protein
LAATAADRKIDLTEIPGAKMATNRAISDADFDYTPHKVMFRLIGYEKQPHVYAWHMLPCERAQVLAWR